MTKIYKTITVPIKCNKEDLDYLYQCNRESARIWNECVRLGKEAYEKDKTFLDQNYFQQVFKSGYSNFLNVKSMQLVSKKYVSCMNGITKTRKTGRTDCVYPYKEKKNFNSLWDYQIIKVDYNSKILYLSKPLTKVDGKKKRQKPIKLHVKNLPKNIVLVELKYDKGLKLAINYYIEEQENQNNINKGICAVDMGEIHAITVVDEQGNREIITGRQIRSYQRFRNKELSKLQNKISKCTKGSKNYKKYKKAKEKLLSKSNQKINNAIHKASKIFIDYIVENKIHTVVIGDLTKFNLNLKDKKQRKGNKQKLVQWPHGKLKQKIIEKLYKNNAVLVEIPEYYTSQICPKCLNKYKPSGRNYICKVCGFVDHRDIVGAINILSSYLNNGEIKPLNLPLKPLKYLRIPLGVK